MRTPTSPETQLSFGGNVCTGNIQQQQPSDGNRDGNNNPYEVERSDIISISGAGERSMPLVNLSLSRIHSSNFNDSNNPPDTCFIHRPVRTIHHVIQDVLNILDDVDF